MLLQKEKEIRNKEQQKQQALQELMEYLGNGCKSKTELEKSHISGNNDKNWSKNIGYWLTLSDIEFCSLAENLFLQELKVLKDMESADKSRREIFDSIGIREQILYSSLKPADIQIKSKIEELISAFTFTIVTYFSDIYKVKMNTSICNNCINKVNGKLAGFLAGQVDILEYPLWLSILEQVQTEVSEVNLRYKMAAVVNSSILPFVAKSILTNKRCVSISGSKITFYGDFLNCEEPTRCKDFYYKDYEMTINQDLFEILDWFSHNSLESDKTMRYRVYEDEPEQILLKSIYPHTEITNSDAIFNEQPLNINSNIKALKLYRTKKFTVIFKNEKTANEYYAYLLRLVDNPTGK